MGESLIKRLDEAAQQLNLVGGQISELLLEAKAEIDRLRAILTNPSSACCTHQCKKCLHKYAPMGEDEDCPVRGHDGSDVDGGAQLLSGSTVQPNGASLNEHRLATKFYGTLTMSVLSR